MRKQANRFGPIRERVASVYERADATFTAMNERARSLVTGGLILFSMSAVIAFIWWVAVLSPIGFGRAFDNIIGGDDMRTNVTVVFLVAIGLTAIGGAASLAAGLRDWAAHDRR